MLTGWLQKNGQKYYFRTNGQMLTGWLQKSGKMYYFRTNGQMLTGWLQKSGKKYYFRTNGQMHTGWLQKNSKKFYFKANGQMVTGRYKIGNKWFTFDKNGVYQANDAVKISKTRTTIVQGYDKTLTITGTSKKVNWSSSDNSIATVSSNGNVHATGKGTCTIRAQVGDKTYKCVVKVIDDMQAARAVENYVKKKYPSCWFYEYEPTSPDYETIGVCITKTPGDLSHYMFVNLDMKTGMAYFEDGRESLFPELPESALLWN